MATFLSVLFIIVCILLILVVLLQKGRGGGLGAMFGGAGSSAFGTRTGDVFTWVTIVLTALFLILAVVVTLAYTPEADTVAVPRFEPAAGPIEQTAYVSIMCDTKGSTVYYTLDESEPTRDSSKYQNNVPVKPGQTLLARGFRPGWQPSPIARGEYPDKRKLATQTATAPAGQVAPVVSPIAEPQ